jgi:hypothetical protein
MNLDLDLNSPVEACFDFDSGSRCGMGSSPASHSKARPSSSSSSSPSSSSSVSDRSVMKTLRMFTDSDLVSQTRMLIREEAKATRQVLLHLMEIERREIHLARGYGSMHSFAVEVLGYSDGSAARRVAAMRLIREMPETAEQLVAGSLTLETMSTLSNHIRRMKPSKEAREELVNTAQNLSKRELEKKLGKPEMTAVYLKPDLMRKLEELKVVFGMTSLERILNQLADQALARARVQARVPARVPARMKEKKRLKKLEREKVSSGRTDSRRSLRETEAQFTPPGEQQPARQPTPPAEQQPARQPTPPPEQPTRIVTPNREPADTASIKSTTPITDSVTTTDTGTAIRSRYVPKPVRRNLICRDQARCAYVDPFTKRQCSETRHLEFDHVQPFSRRGETTEENLRVLCANHNRFRARRMGFASNRT